MIRFQLKDQLTEILKLTLYFGARIEFLIPVSNCLKSKFAISYSIFLYLIWRKTVLITPSYQIFLWITFSLSSEITECFRRGQECPIDQVCSEVSDGSYECLCYEGYEKITSEGESTCQGDT